MSATNSSTNSATKYELLDPKNDFVFKKLFVAKPNLLISLINAVRHDYPPVVKIEIRHPEILPEHLEGKQIVLDVLAEDSEGVIYNVEMQVCKFVDWGARSLYYLARLLGKQLNKGENYDKVRPVVGIHLLDFDLFTKPSELRQALWRFEMRDSRQPETRLTDRLQLNVVELIKADKMMKNQLGSAENPATALQNWILFFEHWREEEIMKSITDPFIHEALGEIQNLSQNEGARWDAFVRERALRDEGSLLADAEKRGIEQGLQAGLAQGLQTGLEQGRLVGKEEGLQEGMEKGHLAGKAEGLNEGLEKGHQDGLSTALTRLINSGIPEAQARQILGLL